MNFDGADRAPKTDAVTGPATDRAGRASDRSRQPGDGLPLTFDEAREVRADWSAETIRPLGMPPEAALPNVPLQPDGAPVLGPAPGIVPADAPTPSGARVFGRVGRALRFALRLAAGLLGGVLALMLVLRYVDPSATPVMMWDGLMGEPVDQRWVPLDQISPRLVRAVIASEDARFCRHNGIDYGALKAAIEDARRGRPRGGSTITMQVVKNLFLWPGRSYVRKAIELPLALALDALWPKRRIIEVYLNIAEWGHGVWGAEAASRRSFGKPARALDTAEAALLAVSLPNPAERDAGDPDDTVERLAGRLEARMRAGSAPGCL